MEEVEQESIQRSGFKGDLLKFWEFLKTLGFFKAIFIGVGFLYMTILFFVLMSYNAHFVDFYSFLIYHPLNFKNYYEEGKYISIDVVILSYLITLSFISSLISTILLLVSEYYFVELNFEKFYKLGKIAFGFNYFTIFIDLGYALVSCFIGTNDILRNMTNKYRLQTGKGNIDDPVAWYNLAEIINMSISYISGMIYIYMLRCQFIQEDKEDLNQLQNNDQDRPEYVVNPQSECVQQN